METRRFKPDENLIFHLIKSQSSTVETAVRELVQNAYDAEATSCQLEIDAHGFRVSDDGRGFADRAEVEACFETFGTPHAALRDQHFGRFRMGRCQIMAFAPTSWRSNQFAMDVDIKQRGLEYQLRDDSPLQPGCEIQGRWYATLSQSALKQLIRNLGEFFEFFYRMPVWLNGKRLSKTLEELPITVETDDCYIIQDDNRPELSIYNLGIYVRPLYGDCARWKLRGTILTKRHLQLDIGRHHIDQTCPVWRRIERQLIQHFPRPKRKGYLSTSQIQAYLHGIFAGTATVRELWTLKLFRDPARTRRFSFADLAASKSFTFAYNQSQEQLADRINQAGKTIVVSLRDIEQVSEAPTYWQLIAWFFEALGDVLVKDVQAEEATEDDYRRLEQLLRKYQPFEAASTQYQEEYGFMSEQELTPIELCAFKAIRAAQAAMLYNLYAYTNHPNRALRSRVLKVGYSRTADGWTDGTSFIALNRVLLKRLAKGMLKSEYVAAVLVHEWCHQAGDSGTHDGEFYRRFHDLTCNGQVDMLATFAGHINRNYALFLQRACLPVPLAVVRHLTGKLGQLHRNKVHLQQAEQAKEKATKLERDFSSISIVLYSLCEFVDEQQVDSMPDNLKAVLQVFNKQEKSWLKSFSPDVDWQELALRQDEPFPE